jgi:CelD/BcsL family acetyltransferase involved in cellulose biosynthesis
MAITRRIIDYQSELERIEPLWRDLLASDPLATPFQSPDWLLPWWNSFGSGTLFTVAVFDETLLVGLAPMFLHTWQGRRQVTLIGNGLSDRLKMLTRPGYESLVIQEILAASFEHRRCWDLCDFQDLGPDDPLPCQALPSGIHGHSEDLYPCYAIPLPSTEESYDASLSSGVRRNLGRYFRHLADRGPVTCQTADSTPAFEEGFDALLRFHKHRRSSGEGAFNACEESFHRAAARRLFKSGALELCILRCGERIAAIAYLLTKEKCAYACLGGFDSEFERFRAGWLVLHYAMKRAIFRGSTRFDFLRGDEEYKRLLGAERYNTRRLILWHDPQFRPPA